MKQLFSILFICSLFMTYTFFAMDHDALDFDKEDGIPLAEIYTKTTTRPAVSLLPIPTIAPSLEERFINFERKLLDEFGGLDKPIKKQLDTAIYLAKIQSEIPEIIAHPETMKNFTQKKNTFFFNAIERLKNYAVYNYTQVTSDTLPTITDPNKKQSCPVLNSLAPTIKAFVMDAGYHAINAAPYKCMELPAYRTVDYHHMTNVAAIANNIIFQMWDLQTGSGYVFPKKACNGKVKFSEDGKQLMTATVHQQEPQIIHIDIWDSITKERMHTIELSEFIEDCILYNTPTQQILFIFHKEDLVCYTIKKDKRPVLCAQVNTMIKSFYYHYDQKKNYELSGRILFKKCIPYFLCSKAIQNTTNKNSLQKVRFAPLYEQLTPIEKGLIEKEIVVKSEKLMQSESGQNIFSSWFG